VVTYNRSSVLMAAVRTVFNGGFIVFCQELLFWHADGHAVLLKIFLCFLDGVNPEVKMLAARAASALPRVNGLGRDAVVCRLPRRQ